jgi:membrane-associated phospholipid phosphatase
VTVRQRAVATYAVALVAWSLTVGIPNDSIGVSLWIWVATLCWSAGSWAQVRQVSRAWWRDWWLPLVLLALYALLRGLADETPVPVHVTAPVRFDEWLGLGTTPTERLQEAWCGSPCRPTAPPRWWDTVLTSVYASHFLASLTVAGVLWVRSRGAWVRWVRRYVVMAFAGLAVYFAYPMAPPWMAARDGYLGAVSRITSRGWADLTLERQSIVFGGLPNKVAAMPSLHAGFAFLLAGYAIQRWRHPARWLLLGYPLAMSLALVYFGEHYVLDVLAGALLAVLVLVGCQWWEDRRAPVATVERAHEV